MKTFIRLAEVMRVTGLRKSAIYVGMAEGWFPLSFKTGARAVAWDEDEINEYQARCMTQRYESSARPLASGGKKKTAGALLDGMGLNL